MKFMLFALLIGNAFALDYGYLKDSDQKYYKNDIMAGTNKQERIDSVVKEINKLHGEIASLKNEIATLKDEVEQLKKKK